VQRSSVAILLFSRDAHEEFQFKSFGLNYQRYQKVYSALVNRVKRTTTATGLPVFVADSQVQQGSDFGSRLLNAIQWVKAQGHDQMIIVGNDSPGLSPKDLLNAADAVKNGHAVLGRDSHGGAYLIGLDTARLDLNRLNQLDWHTAEVFEQLQTVLERTVILDTKLTDINRVSDLASITKPRRTLRKVLQLLRQLVFGVVQEINYSFTDLSVQFQLRYTNRGPPILA